MSALASRRLVGVACLIGFIGCIVAANWAIKQFGFVSVGFGLVAPAGVFFIGLAFTFRDLIQNSLGRWVSVAAIIVGASVSALISPTFAIASGVAALLGEFADFTVYTPLYRRRWLWAVVPANIVGLIVDSGVFLWLAFGSFAHIQGQIVGKLEMTVLAVLLLYPIRKQYTLKPAPA